MLLGTITIDRIAVGNETLARGWYGYELAKKAGISPVTLSRALNGDRISIGTARAIADALKLPLKKVIKSTHGRGGSLAVALEGANQSFQSFRLSRVAASGPLSDMIGGNSSPARVPCANLAAGGRGDGESLASPSSPDGGAQPTGKPESEQAAGDSIASDPSRAPGDSGAPRDSNIDTSAAPSDYGDGLELRGRE